MKSRSRMIILCVIFACSYLCAQDMDNEIKSLSEQMSKVLVAKGKKKIATVDFVDIQGRPTELGRVLAEQLAVEMVNAEGISVVDRANIKNILAEHKLSEEGLVNPENAKKLGQFAGVDALLTGTVTSMDEDVLVTVKAIATDTSEVVAAKKARFKKTKDIQQLLTRGVAQGDGVKAAPSLGAVSEDAGVIATKEVGSLQFVLRNIQRLKIRLRSYQAPSEGVQFVFDVTNRDLQLPVEIAFNKFIGNRGFRSQLIDSTGQKWQGIEIMGVSSVGMQRQGICQGDLTEQDIIRYVSTKKKGDASGDAPNNGNITYWGWCWNGDFTIIPPSETVRMTMTFLSENGEPANSFQFEAEFVVGTGGRGGSKDYSLVNVMLDKVTVPNVETK